MNKAIERRVRRKLARVGYQLLKDRARLPSRNHQGGYQILDDSNRVSLGASFEISLDDAEEFADRVLRGEDTSGQG